MNDPGGVDRGFLESGAYELEVASDRVPARLSMRPLYDPAGTRIKS